MNNFHHTALVKVPPQRLYEIITDIESYPKVISQCKSAQITSRKPLDGEQAGSEEVVAALSLKLGPLKRRFITRNIHTPHSLVRVDLHSGSMHSLQGEWQLTEVDANTSRIVCEFAFSLGNNTMDALAARFLQLYLKHSVEHYIAYAERQQ